MAEQAPPQVDPWQEQAKVNQAMLASLEQLKQGLGHVAQSVQRPAPGPVSAAAIAPPPPPDQRAKAQFIDQFINDPITTTAQGVQLAINTARQEGEQRAAQIADQMRSEFAIRADFDRFMMQNQWIATDPAAGSMFKTALESFSPQDPRPYWEKLHYAAQATQQQLGQRDQYVAGQAAQYYQQQLAAAGLGGSSAPPTLGEGDDIPQDEFSLRRAMVNDMKAEKKARIAEASSLPMYRARGKQVR